jgi:hypothetical protein
MHERFSIKGLMSGRIYMNRYIKRVSIFSTTLAAVGALSFSGLASAATINMTGPGSRNTITFSNRHVTRITNRNDVNVSNSTSQTAHSGNVSISHNTNAGSGRSGDAMNQSDNSFSVDVSND